MSTQVQPEIRVQKSSEQLLKPRILFLSTHPKEVASTRFRIYSYEAALRRSGYDFQVQPFFPTEALNSIYEPWRWHQKASWILNGTLTRWKELRRGSFDLVFIHRELFPWGMTAGMAPLLKALKESGCRIIFDFDDAVYLPHRRNRFILGRLEDPRSIQTLLSISHQVIAGNAHLADYARRFNSHVAYLPTPVDTTRFSPNPKGEQSSPPTIAWIGSPSTTKYLDSLVPVFQELAKRYSFQVKIIGAGQPISIPGVHVDNRAWNLDTETDEFRQATLGVYPLWDDEWSKGKCGFKALQFMSSGVPVVASAVGMNREIIRHGENGFLVSSPEEWARCLGQLLESQPLREQFGQQGRATITSRYSLDQLEPQLIGIIEKTLLPVGERTGLDQGSQVLSGEVTQSHIPDELEKLTQTPQDILCFSSIDWDFVWQGHQEIMSTLAKSGHRILFVENTGVRNPHVRDFARIRRRFQNWHKSLQGFRQVKENLYVFSPLVLPFPYSRLARWLNRRGMVSTIRKWMDAMEFDRPICWTFLPTPLTLEVIDRIPHKALIYYCIDSFVDSTPAANRIAKSEEALLRKANLVFVTSQKLFQHAARWAEQVHLFPFGVNLKAFRSSQSPKRELAQELQNLPRPIVGYIGGIHQWVDQELLLKTARSLPNYSFVMVGPLQTDVQRLQAEPNIHFLGQKSHEVLPQYVQHFDVGLIPYLLTDYTKHVYPTKMNEYHAMAKPVVSTPLPEILSFNKEHQDLIRVGAEPAAFREAIEEALTDKSDQMRQRRFRASEENSWEARIASMQSLILKTVESRSSRPAESWSRYLETSRKISRIGIRALLSVVLFAVVLFDTPLVWWLAKPLQIQESLQPAQAIVVFAGGVGESGRAGEGYRERVKRAVELYQQGYAPTILFVSGHTWTFDESDVMQALSESLGVPTRDILKEKRVSHTWDYCQRVKQLAQSQNWSSILLVTTPYHSRRADLTFRQAAPELKVVHAPIIESQFYQREGWGIRPHQLRGILHETIGILYYWLKGRV